MGGGTCADLESLNLSPSTNPLKSTTAGQNPVTVTSLL